MDRKFSFPPVVAPHIKVLILGSLPGERSLLAGRYYAHPRNAFWHLAGHVIGRDLQALDYDARLAALLSAGIGLWDSVGSASRKGSLDSALRQARPNPLAELVGGLPHLRAVAFNGAASAQAGLSQLEGSKLALLRLPSSSPANAAMSLAQKEKLWAPLQEFLH